MITIEQIQKRIDAMPERMAAKGLTRPNSTLSFRSNSSGYVHLTWVSHGDAPRGGYEFVDFAGPADLETALDAADEWIASLPSREEAERDEFLTMVAAAVDFGRARGFDAEMINPLTDMMRRISENAITYQPAA